MSHRGRNKNAGTSQFWDGTRWVASGAYPDIYVALTGSDTENTGLTLDSPFATLKAALLLAAVSSVKSRIIVGPGDFDASCLSDLSVPNKGYSIEGAEFEILADDLVCASFVSSSRTVNFSGAPGWATDAWMGAFLRWKSGAVGVIEAARTKTIKSSSTAAVSVNYPVVNTSGAVIQPGDVFQIVRPTTRLTGLVGKTLIGGGIVGDFTSETTEEPQNIILLQNLDIVANVNAEESVTFQGGWTTYGVRVVKDFAARFVIVVSNGYFGAGTAPVGVTQSKEGWGLSYLDSEFTAIRSLARLGGVGGRIVADGAGIVWLTGRVIASGAVYPHGAVCAVRGGHITTPSTTQTGRLVIECDAAGADIVAEYGSNVEIWTPIEHAGQSLRFARARQGFIRILRNITVKAGATLAPQLFVDQGGQIRLEVDGAGLGDAVAGTSVAMGQVTRSAALWVAGDAVCTTLNFPKDLANIYRTN